MNVTMTMTVPDINTFFQYHRPRTLKDMACHSKYEHEMTVRSVLNHLKTRRTFLFCSDVPGSGKRTLVLLACEELGLELIHVDETCSLETLRGYVNQMDVTRWIKDSASHLSPPSPLPYFWVDETVVRNDGSPLLSYLCKTSPWPFIVNFTSSPDNLKTAAAHLFRLNKNIDVVRLRQIPVAALARYVSGIASEYRKVSFRACSRVSKLVGSNVRYAMSVLHRLLNTPDGVKLTSDAAEDAFRRSCMDSNRDLSETRVVLFDEKRFEADYRSNLAHSHPVSVHAACWKGYLSLTTRRRKKKSPKILTDSIIHQSDIFSLTDTLPIDLRHHYFVDMFAQARKTSVPSIVL